MSKKNKENKIQESNDKKPPIKKIIKIVLIIVVGIIIMGIGKSAYPVAMKMSFILPSPSKSVVRHQLEIPQRKNGRSTPSVSPI